MSDRVISNSIVILGVPLKNKKKTTISVSPAIILGGQVNFIFSIAPDHNRSHLKLPFL